MPFKMYYLALLCQEIYAIMKESEILFDGIDEDDSLNKAYVDLIQCALMEIEHWIQIGYVKPYMESYPETMNLIDQLRQYPIQNREIPFAWHQGPMTPQMETIYRLRRITILFHKPGLGDFDSEVYQFSRDVNEY